MEDEMIVDDNFTRGPPPLSWGHGNQFSSSLENKLSTHSFVQMTPSERRLVCESHEVFYNLQQALSLEKNPPTGVYLESSSKYRIILQSISRSDDSPESLKYLARLWHLCEIFFLYHPETPVAYLLVNWIKDNYPVDDLDELEVDYDKPESQENYWRLLYKLAVQTDFEGLKKLLGMHSAWQETNQRNTRETQKLWRSIEEHFSKFPYPSSDNANHNAAAFQKWRNECTRLMRNQIFFEDHRLLTFFNFLIGDLQTIAEHTTTWYEHLVAYTVYAKPTLKVLDIEDEVEQLLEIRSDKEKDILNTFMIATTAQNVDKVIKLLPAIGSMWFSTHLTEMLESVGHLKHLKAKGKPLKEEYILEYCSQLMTNQIIANYLIYGCPERGLQHLEVVLSRTPIHSERDAEILLSMCKKWGLNQGIISSIGRTIAHKLFKKKRYVSSLHWYKQTNDVAMICSISDVILNEIVHPLITFVNLDPSKVKEKLFLVDEVILSLKQSIQENDIYNVDKYFNFLQCYSGMLSSYLEGNYKNVCAFLIGAFSTAPRKFWIGLLQDAVFLMENHKALVFGTNETFKLMGILETISTEDAIEPEVEDKRLLLYREILSKNLAKAIVVSTT